MKKNIYLVLVAGLFLLAACGSKPQEETGTSRSSEASALKTRVFEIPLQDGNKQKQTVVYKNNKIQKLVLRNSMTVTEDMKQSLAESGAAETQRLIKESMSRDETYGQLDKVSGLTYSLELTDVPELYITFTLDIAKLDTAALTKSPLFSGSELEDAKVLAADKYIERLENYGGKEILPSGKKDGNDLPILPSGP